MTQVGRSTRMTAAKRRLIVNGEDELYGGRWAARYFEKMAELRRARDGGLHYLDGEGFLE